MRLFVGVPLAAAVVDELSAVSARFSSSQDGLRWTASESWHITLQFLGNKTGEEYACLTAQLRGIRSRPVPVQLDELGFFERAGIFHAGIQLTPALLSLQQSVAAATAQCGCVPETRPYHPHITLARAKGRGRGQGLAELKARIRRQPVFTAFVAGEFLLYESLLLPGGSRYIVRERFPLESKA
jgi:2'-5' RNA ligase